MEDDRHIVHTEMTENGVTLFSDFLRKIWNKNEIEDTEIDLPRRFFKELRANCKF